MGWHEMTGHEMTWDDMTWDDMRWHDMRWHEMTWHDMRWHDMRWDWKEGWNKWMKEKKKSEMKGGYDCIMSGQDTMYQ